MVKIMEHPYFLMENFGGRKPPPLFSETSIHIKYRPPSSTQPSRPSSNPHHGNPGPGGAKPVPLEEISRRPNRGFAAWTDPKAKHHGEASWRSSIFRWIFCSFHRKGGGFLLLMIFFLADFLGKKVTKKGSWILSHDTDLTDKDL